MYRKAYYDGLVEEFLSADCLADTGDVSIDDADPILYFHYMVDGKVQYQGVIKELVANGSGKATFFSFFTGYETDNFTFTKAFLKECLFYGSNYQMRDSYKKFENERQEQESLKKLIVDKSNVTMSLAELAKIDD